MLVSLRCASSYTAVVDRHVRLVENFEDCSCGGQISDVQAVRLWTAVDGGQDVHGPNDTVLVQYQVVVGGQPAGERQCWVWGGEGAAFCSVGDGG